MQNEETGVKITGVNTLTEASTMFVIMDVLPCLIKHSAIIAAIRGSIFHIRTILVLVSVISQTFKNIVT